MVWWKIITNVLGFGLFGYVCWWLFFSSSGRGYFKQFWRAYRDPTIKEKWKRRVSSFLHIGITASIFSYLLYKNWGLIKSPVLPEGTKVIEGLQQLLLTEGNLQVIMVAVAFALTGVTYFLIKLPFVRLEHMKLLGFEYKLQAQAQLAETAQVATHSLKTAKEMERARLSYINTMASVDFMDLIAPYVEEERISTFDVLQLINKILREGIWELVGINYGSGVIRVENNKLVEDDLHHLPLRVQSLIRNCHQKQKDQTDEYEGCSMKAYLIRVDESDTSYCIWYLDTKDIVLTGADDLMIQTAWSLVILHATSILMSDDRVDEDDIA